VPQPPPEDDAQIPQLRQHHQKQLVPHHLSYTPQIPALIIKTDIEYKLKLAREIEYWGEKWAELDQNCRDEGWWSGDTGGLELTSWSSVDRDLS
jgi:hypothetical protein